MPASATTQPALDTAPGQDQRRIRRPGGVTVVACFQLLKAGILLLTGILLKTRPTLVESSQSALYPLLYVATRGRYVELRATTHGSVLLSAVIYLLGVYLAAIGIGLWNLHNWARRSVVFTCGMTILFWAGSALFPRLGTADTISSAPDLQSFYLLLFFNTLVFLYLMRPATAPLFGAARS